MYSNLIPTYYIAAHNVPPDPNQPGWPAATGFLVQAATPHGQQAFMQQPVQVQIAFKEQQTFNNFILNLSL